MKKIIALIVGLVALSAFAAKPVAVEEFKWRKLQNWPDPKAEAFVDTNSIKKDDNSIASGTFALVPKKPIAPEDNTGLVAAIRIAMLDCKNNVLSLVVDVYFDKLKGNLPTLNDTYLSLIDYKDFPSPVIIARNHPIYITLCQQTI